MRTNYKLNGRFILKVYVGSANLIYTFIIYKPFYYICHVYYLNLLRILKFRTYYLQSKRSGCCVNCYLYIANVGLQRMFMYLQHCRTLKGPVISELPIQPIKLKWSALVPNGYAPIFLAIYYFTTFYNAKALCLESASSNQ